MGANTCALPQYVRLGMAVLCHIYLPWTEKKRIGQGGNMYTNSDLILADLGYEKG